MQFDARQFEPSGPGVEQWPDGWVKVVGVDAKVQPNSGGNSGRLSIQIKALEGPMHDKTHFIGFNLWHDNPQTVEIANRQLTSLTLVTLGANKNQFGFQHENELLNIPFYVLATNKRGDDGVARTNFTAFKDVNGREPKDILAGTGPSGGAPASAPAWGSAPQQPQQPQPSGWGGAPQGNPQQPAQQPAQQPWGGGAQQGTPPNGAGNQPAGGGAPGGGWNGPGAQNGASPSNPQGGAPWQQGGGQPQQPAPAPAQGGAPWANNGGGGGAAPWRS
jgi:hypothetical protein